VANSAASSRRHGAENPRKRRAPRARRCPSLRSSPEWVTRFTSDLRRVSGACPALAQASAFCGVAAIVNIRYEARHTNELDCGACDPRTRDAEAEIAPVEAEVNRRADNAGGARGRLSRDRVPGLSKPDLIPSMPAPRRNRCPLDLLNVRPDLSSGRRELARRTARIGFRGRKSFFRQSPSSGRIGSQGQGLGAHPQPSVKHIWIVTEPGGGSPASRLRRLDAESRTLPIGRACESGELSRKTILNAVGSKRYFSDVLYRRRHACRT